MHARLRLDRRRLPPGRPPVLLLGTFNLVRALGLAGIPVIVASSERDDPVFASRYCAGRCHLPPGPAEDVLQALLEAGSELSALFGRRIPLMYGNDGHLELVSAHRERLQEKFTFLLNDPAVAQALVEKSRFQELARERGLPAPRALAWDELRQVQRAVIVKPRQKADWHESPLHERLFINGGKAMVFESGHEAASHPLVELYRNQLTLQEFIPGDDAELWSFHGFADEKGEVLASFLGRKIRTYPPVTGESAYIEMIRDPDLEAFGRIVAQRIPLKGPFKMDFKRDPRDGRSYLLEVNARYTLWHYLGAVNGVNLAQAAYEYFTEGKRARETRYRTDHRWVYAKLDFLAYRALARRGELSFPAWALSLLRSRKVYHMFSWSDPAPYFAHWIARLTRKGRREAERLLTWVRQWLSTAS
jgi:D-aspartate ligase